MGWTVIARNWRCRRGELDLVAIDQEWLVVVEVRARSSARFGTASESVDARKRARLLDLGARFVYERRWSGPWRIDVIAVDPSADGASALTHHRNVVGP